MLKILNNYRSFHTSLCKIFKNMPNLNAIRNKAFVCVKIQQKLVKTDAG